MVCNFQRWRKIEKLACFSRERGSIENALIFKEKCSQPVEIWECERRRNDFEPVICDHIRIIHCSRIDTNKKIVSFISKWPHRNYVEVATFFCWLFWSAGAQIRLLENTLAFIRIWVSQNKKETNTQTLTHTRRKTQRKHKTGSIKFIASKSKPISI